MSGIQALITVTQMKAIAAAADAQAGADSQLAVLVQGVPHPSLSFVLRP